MSIELHQYKAAYRVGLDYHDGKVRSGEIPKLLAQTGLKPTSASILAKNVSYMLKGQCYKRALSLTVTQDYLTWIRRDRGGEGLSHALRALMLHITYCREQDPSLTCLSLLRLMDTFLSSSPSIKESTVVLTWKDAESDGVMDWFPLSWFAEEGSTKELHHPAGEDDQKQGWGYCDVTVKGQTAVLDYRPYAKANDAEDVMLGVVRLTFSDEDRTSIAAVEWLDAGKDAFEECKFESSQYEVPPAPPYVPPTEAADKRMQMVRERPGQQKFRRELKGAYENRCCMTGCTVAEALEGAHIDPYLANESDNLNPCHSRGAQSTWRV